MFPYIEPPTFSIGSGSITAFAVLMWTAVEVGFALTVRRAERSEPSLREASILTAATIVGGLVGSHLFEVVAYQPETLAQDPLWLLRLWDGMSSFGGIPGGSLGPCSS